MKHIEKILRYARNGMFVPFELTNQILDKIDLNTKSSIGVMFSYEMIPVLQKRNFTNITLLVDTITPRLNSIARHFGCNIDTLETGMKFDVVLGNPPYQGSNGAKIWPTFVAKSINQLSAESGHVALVTPVTWCSPTRNIKNKNDLILGSYNRFWDYFKTVSVFADTINVDKHFPKIGSSFGYFIIDKSGNDGLTFSEKRITDFAKRFGVLPNSRRKGFFEGLEMCSEQFHEVNNIASKFEITTKRKEALRVQFPRLESFKKEQIEIADGPFCDGLERIHVYVTTHEEATVVKNKILDGLEIITFYCRYHGRPEGKIVGLLSYYEI